MCRRQFLSDAAGAMARADEAAALAAEHSFPNWLLASFAVKAWSLARHGKPAEGIEQLKGVIGMWQSVGSELCVPYFQTMLADACLHAGRAAEGLEAIDSALSIGARNDDRWLESEAHRLRGELLLLRADPSAGTAAEAEACFRKAHQTALEQGARLLQLRAAVSLAKLKKTTGAAPETVLVVKAALDAFTDGGGETGVPDVVEATALLAAASPA
jgi:predicted ATPase